MYKILVVDDEELICKGLKSMIERSGHKRIGQVFTAYDVEAAKRVIDEYSPEIVITDIRMPDKSGLDLIKEVSEPAKQIKFIVLSGYGEFQYVKDGFKLGIVDYILKPASVNELVSVIDKAISSIEKEKQERQIHASNVRKYTLAMLENNLNRLFASGNAPPKSIVELFQSINISFFYTAFSVGMVSFIKNIQGSTDIENILEELQADVRNKSKMTIIHFFNYQNDLVLIFNMDESSGMDSAADFLKSFMLVATDTLKIECFASLSETGKSLGDIGMLYDHASKALTYKILYKPSELIRYSHIKNKLSDSNAFDESSLIRLREFIVNYRSVDASNLVDAVFSRENIKNKPIERICELYWSFLRIANDAAGEKRNTQYADNYRDFFSFSHLSEIRIYLKSAIFKCIARLKEKNKDKSVINIVKKYINDNYNKNIDMAVVANLVSMSYSYFSKLFKDETGMNFSDYLLKIRMEKAIELLNNPVNKIQDIALEVGYGNNPKHFTRAFKNFYGVSPKEYRESL